MRKCRHNAPHKWVTRRGGEEIVGEANGVGHPNDDGTSIPLGSLPDCFQSLLKLNLSLGKKKDNVTDLTAKFLFLIL
ncbi:hypothetical protein DPMN_014881 [Dreissena polymorpha]|uniref:Uncharacterized protein n=1 Tax=Dreissena polymorpha TaxID=45954 RepID=A0A9D4N6T6_DREPO|nr:hypothetical protein DPMN_014881 [Dreissena polymorpha]